MSFHLAAYNTTITAADGLKALTTVADSILATSGNGFLLPYDLRLVAAYAGNYQIARARVNAPSLLRVGYPSVRPVQQSATTALSAQPSADPNLMTLFDSPILVRASEAVGMDAASAAASTDRVVGLLWLTDKLEPVPPGEAFWLRFTSTTALTANVWSAISPTYDQSIPSGVYSITGVEFTSPGAVAARVVLFGSAFRPGVLAQAGSIASTTSGAARTHRCFYDGSLGVYGTFQTNAPPNIEVLSISADAANTQEGYLRVVRIGDIGSVSAPCPPTAALSGAGGGSILMPSSSSAKR